MRETAARKVARYDTLQRLAHQVDTWFALIDLESGGLRDPLIGATQLRVLGQQLQNLPGGGIYDYLGNMLIHQAEALFRYQQVLAQALQPLETRWGTANI